MICTNRAQSVQFEESFWILCSVPSPTFFWVWWLGANITPASHVASCSILAMVGPRSASKSILLSILQSISNHSRELNGPEYSRIVKRGSLIHYLRHIRPRAFRSGRKIRLEHLQNCHEGSENRLPAVIAEWGWSRHCLKVDRYFKSDAYPELSLMLLSCKLCSQPIYCRWRSAL